MKKVIDYLGLQYWEGWAILFFRIFFLLMYIHILSSCAAPNKNVNFNSFGTYVQEFEAYSSKYSTPIEVTNLTIEFGPLEGTYIGMTYLGEHPIRIVIDKPYWDRKDENYKEMLVFHELGHAVLYRKHINTVKEDGCPVSLMYEKDFDEDCYIKNKNYYLNELFDLSQSGSLF